MSYQEALKNIQSQYVALQRELVEIRPFKITASSVVWFADSLDEIVEDENSPAELRALAEKSKTSLRETIMNLSSTQVFDPSNQLSLTLHDSINSIIEFAIREGDVQ